jgi:hypothetical protein
MIATLKTDASPEKTHPESKRFFKEHLNKFFPFFLAAAPQRISFAYHVIVTKGALYERRASLAVSTGTVTNGYAQGII